MQLQLHLFCLFFTLIIKKFRRTEKVSVLRNLKNQANYSIKCVDGEVQIGLYGFSLALVLPYSGWSVHSMFIKKALKAILSTGIIGDVLNINVRYLDFFKANIFDNINMAFLVL